MATHARAGFTLIELLVVIAIIGILSSVITASLNTARDKGMNAKIEKDIAQYRIAFEMYLNEHGEYPDPGDLSVWHCLGYYPDGRCWGNGSSYASLPSLDAAVAGVIPGLPAGPFIASWEGYVYQCTARVNGTCSGYSLNYFMNGANQRCNGERVLNANYTGLGVTYCAMLRSF